MKILLCQKKCQILKYKKKSHDLEFIIFQHRKYIVIICLANEGGLCCFTMCLPTFFGGEFGATKK